ncbi:cytochrome oxidase assembly protein ShyY1 [Isoptericola jiangsuensis]|uniref:SURF1-like protein n=1 Tax=Isoptericola jiangsuensis TaxID=548579 RepID=A0A2A9EWJ3_9MICO|nr:SURF1 family protein [Isoptericola jiangsuensis]PFG42956.1 cytochrome oxidase assembly protein ShyY1 [Isoptericola jiangsuensis]
MTRTRRQWVTLGLGAVLLAALCVTAAFWQWHRYTDREAQIALVEANYAADPVPLDDVLDGPGDVLADDDVWRPAVVVGEYLPQDTVLLRNRPVNGTPGFHLLVPLRTQLDGQDVVLVVDRGFVPLGADASEPAEVPDPPAGEVAVTVTLRADEPASDRDANQSSVNAVNTAQVLAAGADGAALGAGETVGAYGQLRGEDPAPATALVPAPAPDTDPGSHLSYTFQWAIFAIGAISGYVVLWRRETRAATVTAGQLLAGDDPSGGSRPPRTRRRKVDEDVEDALVDAAHGPRA